MLGDLGGFLETKWWNIMTQWLVKMSLKWAHKSHSLDVSKGVLALLFDLNNATLISCAGGFLWTCLFCVVGEYGSAWCCTVL